MTAPVWTLPAGSLGTLQERKTVLIPTTATGAVSYSVISGALPTGIYLNTSTGVLLGTPVSVPSNINSTFVIRATNASGVSDRTFNLNIEGVDAPVWATPSGTLPVGLNGEYYTINKEYVDYRLRAYTDILSAGNTLKYFIADGAGELPPGLKLSTDGRITGYTKDTLKIDALASLEGGYDTETYDRYPYEHSTIDLTTATSSYVKAYPISIITNESPCRIIITQGFDVRDKDLITIAIPTPAEIGGNITELAGNQYFAKILNNTTIALYTDRTLTTPVDSSSFHSYTGGGYVQWGSTLNSRSEVINKLYQFYVTVTDGIAQSQRLFTIEVVDPDSLRVDTSYITIDDDMYDVSAGYLLAPIWQSKYGDKLPAVFNLGAVRANRQQVLSIYDYDPYPIDGPSFFDWRTVTVNPDIKLYSDSKLTYSQLPTKNLKGDTAIYFKDAEVWPVKGMKIQLSETIPNFNETIYTVTGVIKLTETSGILNLDQPLYRRIPDSKIFYVGTRSEHPPGMLLDTTLGTIYGRLSYQPTYSASYRFTVKVIKIDQVTDQDMATSTFKDAIGTNDARIVSKIYTTLDAEPPVGVTGLPNASSYTGQIGDIILVGKNAPIDTVNVITTSTATPTLVDSENLLPLMDGTLRAYIFTGGDAPKWVYVGDSVAANQIYVLNILGEVPSAITFISSSSLGTLASGEISELAVKAVNTNTNYTIEYEIISGQLPPGLTFNQDGTIQGKLTNTGQTYFDFSITTATFVGHIVENVLTVDSITSGEIIPHQIITTIPDTGNEMSASILSGVGNTWKVSNDPNPLNFTIHNTTVVGDIDYVKFTTGDQPITALYLTKYVSTDNRGWFALQQGSAWTAPQDRITSDMLAYGHFGPSGTWHLGDNVLRNSSPLAPNTTYSMWIQQTGAIPIEYVFSTDPTDRGNTLPSDYSSDPSTPTTIRNIVTATFYATTLLPNYSTDIEKFDANTTTIDKNWFFTVRASDVYRLSAVEKEFYITVYQDTLTKYTRIYVKPFMPAEKRIAYKEFLSDPLIFDPATIYRPYDPEFGIQTTIKMILETGIEQVSLDQYADAMSQYFHRKSFYFGDVKSIKAQDSNGNDVYEIVYIEIIDNQMNGITSPSYAVSVGNMQNALRTIDLSGSTVISVNERLQPKYMTTLQSDTGVPIGFVKAVPICYTIPGGSLKVLSRITNAFATGQFDFKQYYFDTDRIIVETTQETAETGWLLYPTDHR